MKINRRAFLTGVSAIAISPTLPKALAAPVITGSAVVGEPLTIVGALAPAQKRTSMMIREIIDRALNEEFHGAYTQTDEQWRRIFAEARKP